MNTHDRRSLLKTRLNQLLEQDPTIGSHPSWNQRLGEVIATAGFGHAEVYDFDQQIHLAGQYIPDRSAIEECIRARGFSVGLTGSFVRHFASAVNAVADNLRADLVDDLDGPFQMLNGRRLNELRMREWIHFSLDDEKRRSRLLFRTYILDDNPQPDLFKYEYQLPAGFPDRTHLNTPLELRITVRYDLDGGADPRAVNSNLNRQLALVGTMHLKPTGPRGWGFPTIKYDDEPIRDDRNRYERDLQPNPRPGKKYDNDQYNKGMDAADLKTTPPEYSERSEAWWAGFIMRGGDCIAWAHMGTGRVDVAYKQAKDRAEALQLPDAAELAANACRHYVATPYAAALEDVIRDHLRGRRRQRTRSW